MPQLDKLSFSTQYFWLTLFFFLLYFISTNFFVIVVFKSLKIRNIIYKIWYFFVFKFDYSNYETKNKNLNSNSFNSTYSVFYSNLLTFFKKTFILTQSVGLTNKLNEVNSISKLSDKLSLNTLNSSLKQINNIDIDAI